MKMGEPKYLGVPRREKRGKTLGLILIEQRLETGSPNL